MAMPVVVIFFEISPGGRVGWEGNPRDWGGRSGSKLGIGAGSGCSGTASIGVITIPGDAGLDRSDSATAGAFTTSEGVGSGLLALGKAGLINVLPGVIRLASFGGGSPAGDIGWVWYGRLFVSVVGLSTQSPHARRMNMGVGTFSRASTSVIQVRMSFSNSSWDIPCS